MIEVGPMKTTMTTSDLVLVRSDLGDGGWSLHPAGTTDEQIAEGEAIILASGTANLVGGELLDYDTADFIRVATPGEARKSLAQANRDGGSGVIRVDERSCYVVNEEWDAPAAADYATASARTAE